MKIVNLFPVTTTKLYVPETDWEMQHLYKKEILSLQFEVIIVSVKKGKLLLDTPCENFRQNIRDMLLEQGLNEEEIQRKNSDNLITSN